MTDRPTCETCRFRGRYAAMPACRRNPPGSGGGGVGWPRVSLDDWCGRHKPKPKPDPITEAMYGDGGETPKALRGLSTRALPWVTAFPGVPPGALEHPERARVRDALAEAAMRLVGEEDVLGLGRNADYPAIGQVAETALLTAAAKKIKEARSMLAAGGKTEERG